MPRNRKTASDPLRSVKNDAMTANARKTRHTKDRKRLQREIVELRNQLAICQVAFDGEFIKITPSKPSRRISTLLNAFAYVAKKGTVATQKENETFIYPEDYHLVINDPILNLKEKAQLKEIPLSKPAITTQKTPINKVFVPEEEIRTYAQRQAYHQKEQGRYRRDVNTLKRFFEKNPIPAKTEKIAYSATEELHRDVTALNDFSYIVNADKVASRFQLEMKISSTHYLALKKYADTLTYQNRRKETLSQVQNKIINKPTKKTITPLFAAAVMKDQEKKEMMHNTVRTNMELLQTSSLRSEARNDALFTTSSVTDLSEWNDDDHFYFDLDLFSEKNHQKNSM